MDAGVALVVILFVVTIFSSLGSSGAPPTSRVETQPASIEVQVPVLSHQTLPEKVNPLQNQLYSYILKYRPEDQAQEISASIIKYGRIYNVDPKLVTALIARESRFNPSAVSSSGAIGLGQLLPNTCKTVGINDPYDIDQNVKGTTRYMQYLLERFSSYPEKDKIVFALAGYFEGPNAIARNQSYKKHTGVYITDILNIYNKI